MSSEEALNDPQDVETSDGEMVSIDVESLIIGRAIRFPIHDRSGVLLLKEGAVISDVFKQKLRDRSIARLDVRAEDAGLISTEHLVKAMEEPEPKKKAPRDSDTDTKMKKAVDDGLQFVTNEGPAVMESVEFHGEEAYKEETKAQITKKSQDSCGAIDQLMKSAKSSKSVDGAQLREAVSSTLGSLCDDFDCVNSSALHLSEDAGLSQHCYRMSILGMSIAVEMGLNDDNICRIGVTGLLHDWGMLKIPEHIRNPKRPLTKSEELERQKHVMYSVDLLEKVQGLPTLVTLVSYQIHEQLDGSGYPRGRKGSSIHLFARILNVADAYVTLTTTTPLRKALSPYDATAVILKATRAGKYDPNVVRGMLRAQSLFPVGSIVMLSSGKMARVLRANGDKFTQPIVQVLQDERGRILPDNGEGSQIVNMADSDCFVSQALPILHGPEPIPAPHFLKKAAAVKKLQKAEAQAE